MRPFVEIDVRELIVLAVLGSACCVAAAQREDTEEFDGKWTARIHGADGVTREGRVTIGDYKGTWTEVARKDHKANPCAGRKPIPITVQRSERTDFEFTVWGAMVQPSCPDVSVALKPVDATTLEGTTGDGAKVRLTRPPKR